MSDVKFDWARGANARDNHKREGKSSLRSGLPLPLKVFSRALFPYLSPSLIARRSRCVLLGGSCPERFRRPRPPAYAPDVLFHYSLFILHYSPFTLSIGAVAPQKPPRGVCCECWVSHAAGSRRKMPARATRPEGNGCGHCPPPRSRLFKNICFFRRYVL